MATEVAVINSGSGVQTFYSTYTAARTAANSGDLIQIWADLTNEQILLKDGVDIWVVPGRIINMTSALPTIVDNDIVYTTPVTCNITGYGIIKNDNSSGNCIKIINGSSNVSIQCDSIEAVGTAGTTGDPYKGASVLVTNIIDAQKFSLICNKVSNQYNAAIAFDTVTSGTNKNTINIKVKRIDTGVVDDDFGGPGLAIKGTGFIDIDEISCYNSNQCLLFQGGTVTANILKMTTRNVNHFSSPFLPAVEVSGGDGTQKLTLYFDEIQIFVGGDAVEVSNGTASIIGRRIYSQAGLSLDLSSNVECLVDEIISGTKGIYIHNVSSQKVIIESNYIEGSNGNSGVIKSAAGSNYVLRNAKIKNTYTGSSSPYSRGIYIEDGSQTIEIENLIIVTGTTTNDFSIFRAGSTNIDIKNLGLFVKKAISGNITLKIGTGIGTGENFKYIISNDIT
ncbi:MAG: hypothetical protein ABIY50_09970 [Ignavibacteria bacterium]